MKIETRKNNTCWLSKKLKLRVREVFEPRYGHELDEEDVTEIADNLVNFFESFLSVNTKFY